MKFRFVFHNPHTNIWFKRPLYFFLTKRRSVDKYDYFLNYCLDNKLDIAFLCDGADFSFGRSIFKGRFAAKVELILWFLINKINPFKVKIITSYNKLTEQDVIFSFLYGNFIPVFESIENSRDKLITDFKNCKAFKIVHVTHYMFNASMGARNTRLAGINLFVAENNLFKNSKFFQHYYAWYKKDVCVLPFVSQKRFKKTKDFKERNNKVVATGTLPPKMTDSDFLNFFKSGDIHPMRRAIYDHRDELKEIIDSFIAEAEEGKKVPTAKNKYQIIKKIYAQIYKNFFVKQKKYFSFNIVELYNSYKMFIVPEEINDLPGISFIEGMSCGSVYIGKSDPMYTDMGLIDGLNYIAYDGTQENLIEKIKFYQANNDLLELIAKNSYEFVQQNIQPEIVIRKFFNAIENYLQKKEFFINE